MDALIDAVLLDFGGPLDADGLPWKTRLFCLCRDEGLVTAPKRFDSVFYAVGDALVGGGPAGLAFRSIADMNVSGAWSRWLAASLT